MTFFHPQGYSGRLSLFDSFMKAFDLIEGRSFPLKTLDLVVGN